MSRLFVRGMVALIAVGFIFISTGYADETYEFTNIRRIKFEGVSGDITLLKNDGSGVVVELYDNVRPRRKFRAEVEEEDGVLYIEERWSSGHNDGEVRWTIYLPETKKPIKFKANTASGNLTCREITARIKFNTASGDIELTGVNLPEGSSFNTASGDILLEDMILEEESDFSTASGDIELSKVTLQEECSFSTASGDVRCRGCSGKFKLSSASGDVSFKDGLITGRSSFSSASGNVTLVLDKLPKFDLKVSTASGRVLLDVDDFGDNFTLVMVKRRDRGRISCPFEYTSEDTFEDYQIYEEKVVERGKGGPEIYLSTASGKVTVKN